MKLSDNSKKFFFDSMEAALPGLEKVLSGSKSEVYLIGAGVFELYSANEWCDDLSRSTTDLDFSLEILGSPAEYRAICQSLLDLQYKLDETHPYRYISPSKIGRFIYVDLLTFTLDVEMETEVRALMGVGEGFSFKGMDFAKEGAIQLKGSIFIPNPLAFIYLKMVAYKENPENRLKDFVDIFEFVVGCVIKNTVMGNLKSIGEKSSQAEKVIEIKKMIKDISQDSNPKWDYDQASNQILLRTKLEDYQHEQLMEFFQIFHSEVF